MGGGVTTAFPTATSTWHDSCQITFFSCSIDIRCSFFLWTGFPALQTIQMFAGYVKCIPNAAHSLSSMAMLYIQTLRWRWFRPSNWNLTMHRTWAIAS